MMNKLQNKKQKLNEKLAEVRTNLEDTNQQLELLLKQFAERQDTLNQKLIRLSEKEVRIQHKLEVIEELLNEPLTGS